MYETALRKLIAVHQEGRVLNLDTPANLQRTHANCVLSTFARQLTRLLVSRKVLERSAAISEIMSRSDDLREERLREYLSEMDDNGIYGFHGQHVSVLSVSSLGDTPLHIAVCRGDHQIVSDMLDAGADINAKGEEGFSALHSAVMFDDLEMVRLLLARGASVDTVNGWGEALIDTAVRRGVSEIIAAVKAHA